MEPPEFEFDPTKSAANRMKHGIDFAEAQALWDDERLLELEIVWAEEPRRVAIGILRERHWAAIYTLRGRAIRIISVRRARTREVGLYESQ